MDEGKSQIGRRLDILQLHHCPLAKSMRSAFVAVVAAAVAVVGNGDEDETEVKVLEKEANMLGVTEVVRNHQETTMRKEAVVKAEEERNKDSALEALQRQSARVTCLSVLQCAIVYAVVKPSRFGNVCGKPDTDDSCASVV